MRANIVGADQSANSDELVKALAVTSSPAWLYSVTGFNTGVADVYVQLFDTTGNDANYPNGTPKIQIKVLADSHFSIDFVTGRLFTAGIRVVASSTSGGFTAIASNDMLLDATYRKY